MDSMGPAKLASNVREAKDPCFGNFKLFLNELQKMFRDNDRFLNSAMTTMQENQQLPNESVREYCNCLNANWRRAGRSLIAHQVVLYDMVWAGLWHALMMKVKPWISRGKDRFNRLDHLFDCVAALELNLHDKIPGGEQ